MITTWRDVLPVHPAADIFPMMTRDELIALGEDIKKNGLRHRVAVIEDPDDELILIDGRNRLDAMQLVGLDIDLNDVVMKAYCRKCRKHGSGFDPYDYVISANIHRRHLTAEQRRDLIAKLLKATPEKSNRRIAEQVKADDKTVGKVRRELEATAEIPQLETTTGKDGKARKQPIKKKRRDVDDYLADKRAEKQRCEAEIESKRRNDAAYDAALTIIAELGTAKARFIWQTLMSPDVNMFDVLEAIDKQTRKVPR